jgi:hypothetical protein
MMMCLIKILRRSTYRYCRPSLPPPSCVRPDVIRTRMDADATHHTPVSLFTFVVSSLLSLFLFFFMFLCPPLVLVHWHAKWDILRDAAWHRLCAHLYKLSTGHMAADKHVLRYLKDRRGTRFIPKGQHGKLTEYFIIWLPDCLRRQGILIPPTVMPTAPPPDDASCIPMRDINKHDRMLIDECGLLSGVTIIGMGGALAWKSNREKKVSRESSCESEIHQ